MIIYKFLTKISYNKNTFNRNLKIKLFFLKNYFFNFKFIENFLKSLKVIFKKKIKF